MKKSSFAAMVLGTISGVFFSLGMCMALLEEWNAFKPGVVMGCAGLVLALITVIVWRKMEHKAPIHISGRNLMIILVAIVGSLGLGVGMCYCMVWDKMVLGILIGLIGIVVLMSLIPICKGFKEE